MSVDLERRVRDYWVESITDLPRFDAGELMGRDQPTGVVTRVHGYPVGRVNRGWRAAAAAVMVGLLIGGVAWLTRGSPEGDVIEQPSATTVPTPPTSQTTQMTQTIERTFRVDDLGGDPVPLNVIDSEVTPSVIGDIRWTMVETNVSVVPSGLAATAFGFGSISRDGGLLLVSDDAIEWRSVPSPVTGWLPPQEGEGRAWGASGVVGDEESGYAILSQREGGVIQDWHSTDFIEWNLVGLPDHSANPFSLYFGSAIQRSDAGEPSDAEPLIDPPPRFDGGSCEEYARVTAGDPGTLVYIDSNGLPCGELRQVDSGWVFGFGKDLQGGEITLWASADGENWEVVDSSNVPEFGNVNGNGGIGWDVSSAGNVIILTASGPMPSTGTLDSTTPAWYWVIELP